MYCIHTVHTCTFVHVNDVMDIEESMMAESIQNNVSQLKMSFNIL